MKYSILLISAFLISFTLSAQKFRIGPKVSIGTSTISDLPSTSTHLSYGGGLFASFKFAMVGVQADVLYQSAGASTTFAGTTSDLNLNYLQIPVLAKLYFLKVINIQAGPYYGLLLNVDATGGAQKSDYETSDLGMVAGLGVEVWRLNLNARYQLGFTEVDAASIKTPGFSFKNRMMMVGIGFSLVK